MHRNTTMKPFNEYLQESIKKYDFRVKIAGELDKDTETKLESILNKWNCTTFKKVGTTPVQQFPLDFPKIKNAQVSIYEVSLDYPATQFELTEYIKGSMNIAAENLVVRRPGEPSEQYQEPVEQREGALLDNQNYEEHTNAKFEDFYGDVYNTGFIKELNDILKLQRKERGEVIPEAKADEVMTKANEKTTNGIPQLNKAPIMQAYDPRK